MTWHQWLLFVGIWTLAGLPLGPNALNCIAVSASEGFLRSLRAVLGILIAACCHKAATIFGMAALLLANAELFFWLKLGGAAYLAWMGLSLWRKRDGPLTVTGRGAPRKRQPHIVRRAFFISMSNPKAILSYLAVFSQFLTPGDPLAERLLVLVPTALAVTAAVYVGYCAVGIGIGRFLRTPLRCLVFNRTIGSFYLAAGAGLALSEAPAPGPEPGRAR